MLITAALPMRPNPCSPIRSQPEAVRRRSSHPIPSISSFRLAGTLCAILARMVPA